MNNGIFCWQFPLNNYGFYEFHYHPPSQSRPSSYYMYVKKREDICNIYLHSAESRSTTYSKERTDSRHGLFKFALIFTSPTKLSKEIKIHDLFAWT